MLARGWWVVLGMWSVLGYAGEGDSAFVLKGRLPGLPVVGVPAEAADNAVCPEPMPTMKPRMVPCAGDGKIWQEGLADPNDPLFPERPTKLVPGASYRQADVDRIGVQRVSWRNGNVDERSSGDSPAIDGNGNYVAFVSRHAMSTPASMDLDLNDGKRDVYRRDLRTNAIVLVSGRPRPSSPMDGVGRIAGDKDSDEPSISRDGCFVAFSSYATDLGVGLPTGGFEQIYVANVCSRTMEVITVPPPTVAAVPGVPVAAAAGHSWSPSISADGRYVVFASQAPDLVSPPLTSGRAHIYVYDRQTKVTKLISIGFDGSEADASSTEPMISADGRVIVFTSKASNLTALLDNNGVSDVFAANNPWMGGPLVPSVVEVSRINAGVGNHSSQEPSVSANGTVIAFSSDATNLGDPQDLADTNNVRDIYVWNWQAGVTTHRISLGAISVATSRGNIENQCQELKMGYAAQHPVISPNGMKVLWSTAHPWVINVAAADDQSDAAVDSNQSPDVFLTTLHSQGLPTSVELRSTSRLMLMRGRYVNRLEAWVWEWLRGNGASYTEGKQLFADDNKALVFTSEASNFAGPAYWQDGYLCEIDAQGRQQRREFFPSMKWATDDVQVYYARPDSSSGPAVTDIVCPGQP